MASGNDSALDPLAVGHYVGESDILSDPARAKRSFARKNWQHLQALRQKYDPDALFHGTSAHKIVRAVPNPDSNAPDVSVPLANY